MLSRQQLIGEAVHIGNALLKEIKKTESGWYWETISLNEDNDPVWGISESLYSGTGGIVFFFLELFKVTQDNKYLNAAENGAEWLIQYCDENPTAYYAFFTGRMGVSYLLLKCYEVTNNEYYLEHALEIAKDCEKFLSFPRTINDLINGLSGTLLGLIHVHSFSKKDWILEKIETYARRLLHEIKYDENGIYWDLDEKHSKPLCGFSHGTSGIGYVFLELGHYFNNNAFYDIAEQAFAYENAHFDEAHQNWPDFRKGFYDDETYEEHKAAYLENDLDFFFQPSFMTAWCHGSPGIGLSRVRAFNLHKNDEYKADIERAVGHTYQSMKEFRNYSSYTLCHGKGGNALLFIDAYRQLGGEKYLNYAHKIAEQAIKSHKVLNKYIPGYNIEQVDEDTSLFMGKAGVGYFYLQCMDKTKEPTILAPHVDSTLDSDSSAPTVLNISLQEIRKIILKKAFPRTLEILEHKFPDELSWFLKENTFAKNETEVLSGLISELHEKGNRDALERIEDVFLLEKHRIELKADSNPAYLHIQDNILSEPVEELLKMDDPEFLKQELQLSNTISFCKTKWNWSLSKPDIWEDNFNIPTGEYKIIHYKKMPVISEFTDLSDFTATVFRAFQEPKTVKEAVSTVCKSMGIDKNEPKLKQPIIEQIKEGLKARILIIQRSN